MEPDNLSHRTAQDEPPGRWRTRRHARSTVARPGRTKKGTEDDSPVPCICPDPSLGPERPIHASDRRGYCTRTKVLMIPGMSRLAEITRPLASRAKENRMMTPAGDR